MIKLAFQKWEATGNDFFFIDEVESCVSPADVSTAKVVEMCFRGSGQGADGVVFYARRQGRDATMVLLNSDGSHGDMCGNALRCLAKILHLKTGLGEHRVQLKTRSVQVQSGPGNLATVFMGEAEPISGTKLFDCPIELTNSVKQDGYLVSFGNPHFVQPVSEIPTDWIELGESLQEPADSLLNTGGVNAGFLKRSADQNGDFQLRVFERGAGATQSCGSGACAASAVLQNVLKRPPPHKITLTGGTLTIDRRGDDYTLTGPANLEYEGFWEL